LDKFTNSLTEKQKLEFAVTKYEDVEDAIEQIQQQYGEKKELQNMYRIQSFLEAMNEYGKVVEVFLNCTPFVAYIWVHNHFIDFFLPFDSLLTTLALGSSEVCSASCQLMERFARYPSQRLRRHRREGPFVPSVSVAFRKKSTNAGHVGEMVL
jgi:hypothetical protein